MRNRGGLPMRAFTASTVQLRKRHGVMIDILASMTSQHSSLWLNDAHPLLQRLRRSERSAALGTRAVRNTSAATVRLDALILRSPVLRGWLWL
jgi:hypothetical protein